MFRILSTIAVFVMWGWAQFIMSSGTSIGLGYVAGHQFDNSDASAIAVQGFFGLAHYLPTVTAGFAILVLLALWWTPAKNFFKKLQEMDHDAATWAIVLAVAGSLLMPVQSKAYYDQQNWPENIFIQPQESAFWIPDQGANKDSQTKFGSEQYYRENKIAAKRFDIPHIQLPASSYYKNFFVPAGRLIIVDRTPVSRVWVAQAHRGTSKTDQSFPCQSVEGLDVSAGVSIGVNVTEEDAPKFLYNFGTHTIPGDRTKPEVAFNSVYYGYSLAEVMDQRIQPVVQYMVCDEFTKKPLDEINKTLSTEIMPKIRENVTVYLANYGIKLDFIGWADTLDFDPKVQKAINQVYISGKEAEVARALAPVTKTLQELANAEATREMASKWNGVMPGSLTIFGEGAPGILGAILTNPNVKK